MSVTQKIIKRLKRSIYNRNNDDLLKLLQQNRDIDLNLKYDDESLIHLALKRSPDILETLIRHGADVNAKDGDDDNAPLHVAVRDNRVGMVKILLQSNADANAKNKQGDTPLHIALQRDHFPSAEELLRWREADENFIWNVNIDQSNNKGESPKSIINNKGNQWKELIEYHSADQLEGDVPEFNRVQEFTVTDGGLSGMDGNMYQVLMFLLISIRSRKHYRDFQIMTEIEQAGKLDDIVIKYLEDGEWHWRFIQVKHKNGKNQDKNEITIRDLKTKTEKKLQLKNYVDCIINISKNELFREGIFEDGIICTTAVLDEETKSIFKDKSSLFESDRLLYFSDVNFKGRFGQLIRQEFEDKILTEQDRVWKEKTESSLKQICEKLYFLTSYLNVFYVKELILKELEILQDKNAEFINGFLVDKCLDHIMRAKGKPMDKSDIDELIEKFESHLATEQCIGLSNQNIKNHTFEFKEPLLDLEAFLNSSNTSTPLIIRTKRVELALINVVNEFKVRNFKEGQFLVFNSKNLQNEKTRKTILKALKYSNRSIYVFVECQSFLEETLSGNFNTKIIFIEESSHDHENDSKLRFESLTEESQNNLIKKKNFWLIEKENNTFENYIERNLTIESSTHEEAASLVDAVDGPKTFKEQEFLGANNLSKHRLIVVVGDPGMGKSLLLQNVKHEMKKKNHLVILLNLNDFTINRETQPFHLSKAIFPSYETVTGVYFLIGMLKSAHEIREDEFTPLFFDLLELSLLSDDSSHFPRLVILLDAFDEISPKYEKNVFRLVEALKSSRAFQIWLTTRPHESKKISHRLQYTNYTLAPFNLQNKIEYLLSYCTSFKNKVENDLNSFNSGKKNFLSLFFILIAERKDLNDNLQSYKDQFCQLFDFNPAVDKIPSFDKNIGHYFNNMLDNPLQFLMLLSLCSEPTELAEMSIAEIYERFVEMKFKIFFKKDSHSDGENASQISHRQLCEKKHFKFACNMLFPNNIRFLPVTSESLSDIARVGLISKQGEEYKFLHKSFAEFLAAKYLLSQHFFNDLNLMNEILVEDSYIMLCTFLNDELKKCKETPKWSQNKKLSEESLLICNANGENAIHKAAERGHTEIIKYIRNVISNRQLFQESLMATTESGETVVDKAGLSFDYKKLFDLFENTLGEHFSTLMQTSKLYIVRIIKNSSKSGKYKEMIEFFFSFGLSLVQQLKLYISHRNNYALLEILHHNQNAKVTHDLNLIYDDECLIHLALKSSPDILETLIIHGADVNAKYGDNDNTPLHVAVRDNRVGMVKILLQSNADANAKNKQGDTPLHIALQRDHLPSGKELLKRNADGNFTFKVSIDQQNNKGESPKSIINNMGRKWKKLTEYYSAVRSDENVVECNRMEDFTVNYCGLGVMRQYMYYVLMFLLICIRARKHYDDFQIMNDIKAVGKFDDIAIRYLEDDEWHWRFFCLVHKNNISRDRNMITIQKLKNKFESFELMKYIKSIIKILNHEQFKNDIVEDFIICTTVNFDEDSENLVFKDKTVELQNDRLLYFNDKFFKGKLGQLNRKEFEEKILTAGDNEWMIMNDSILREVYKKFYIVASYPNVVDLKKRILNEINQLQNSEVLTHFLISKIMDHILSAKGKPMNKSEFNHFIDKFENLSKKNV